MLNPIVVLDGSTCPKEEFPFCSYDGEIVRLLSEFDPDVLFNFTGEDLPKFLEAFSHRTYDNSGLRWNPWGKEEISFFLEVWPFLAHYW